MTALILLLVRLVFGLYDEGKFLQFFLQLRTVSEIRRIYVVRCFKLVAGILYCTFFSFTYNFVLQLLSSRPIAQNVKALFKKHV